MNTRYIEQDQKKIFKGLCKSRIPECVTEDLQQIGQAFLYATEKRFPTYSRKLIDSVLVPLLMDMKMHRSALVCSVAHEIAGIINDYCQSLPAFLLAYEVKR